MRGRVCTEEFFVRAAQAAAAAMGCMCSCAAALGVPRAHYDNVSSRLRTGDIVLFAGTGLESAEVQWATCSAYSHIGMVVRCRNALLDQDDVGSGARARDQLYLWHSPSGAVPEPDVLSGRAKDGPQLNPLADMMRIHSGDVYVRRLRPVVRSRVRHALGDPCDGALLEYMRGAARKPYEQRLRQLVLSEYDGPGGRNDEDTSSYFCSELVAHTYAVMGLLPGETVCSEYVPSDFAGRFRVLGDGDADEDALGPRVKVLYHRRRRRQRRFAAQGI